MTDQPLTDERARLLRDTMSATIGACMSQEFSPFQIGAMMAALGARLMSENGDADAIERVVRQLRKAAADAGHVGIQ